MQCVAGKIDGYSFALKYQTGLYIDEHSCSHWKSKIGITYITIRCVCVISCQPLLFQVLSIHFDNSLCGELRRLGLVFVYLIGCFMYLKHENPLCGERIVFRFAWLYRALLIWISSLNLSLASLNAFYSNVNFRLVEERRRVWSERQIFECDCVNILSLR